MQFHAFSARGATAFALALAVLCVTVPSRADDAKLLGTFHDWRAYTLTTDGDTICYALSVPKQMTPKTVVRKGKRVTLSRGDVYITVTHRPATETSNEVNVIIGYPFEKDSRVAYTIDGRKHTLFTMEDRAWAYDAKSDAAITKAMERGRSLVVTGTSSRGTTTKDTYSLSGFTAAHNAIDKACNVK